MIKIYPSVMARNQQEINQTLQKLRGVARTLHLDVGDGKFVSHKYAWFDVKLSSRFKYNAHLMVKDPTRWIQQNGKKVDTIIFHPEPLSEKQILETITLIKKMNLKVGLALKPETTISSIKKYLFNLDYVLILTVHPGKYGARYLKASLQKIKLIKTIHPKIKTIVDGGIRPETISDAVRAGADVVVSGSFVTRAEDPKKAMRELKRSSLSQTFKKSLPK